jgi:ribosome biogenesis GTPase
MGLDGDFNPRRLERCPMVAQSCDVAPVVMLTKGDLVPDADDKAAQPAAACRFHDCTHVEEPGCAVRGVVDADRLRNYHKLLREVRHAVRMPLDRIAERSRWKMLNRMARARAQAKR